MKINKKKTRFLAGILALTTLFSTQGMMDIAALAEEQYQENNVTMEEPEEVTKGVKSGSVILSAGMYKNSDISVIDTMLTEEGATLENWEYDSGSSDSVDRYLGIELSDLSVDKQYRLIIEMQSTLYINLNSIPTDGNAVATYTQNEPLVVNTDSQYVPNQHSLSNLTYEIKSGTKSWNLSLPFRFDVNLWNKQNGANLGNEVDPLLQVTLQEKTAEDTYINVSDPLKLQQATVSGQIGFAANHRTYIVNGLESSTMGVNDTIRLYFTQFPSNVFFAEHYAKETEIQIQLPSCKVGETTYRLAYDNVRFLTSGGSSQFESEFNEETGLLTLHARNFHFKSNGLFEIQFTAPKELEKIPGNYIFTGHVSVISDGVVVANQRGVNITVDTTGEPILIKRKSDGSANIHDLDTVQLMGNLSLENTATEENGTGPLLISLAYDVNETKAVAVTTVNLMCDRVGKTITLTYTLVDKNGNPAYPDSNGDNRVFTQVINNPHYKEGGGKFEGAQYKRFTRNDLDPIEMTTEEKNANSPKQYYFKTLSYTMGNFAGNSKGCNPSAYGSPYNGGSFWGYVTKDAVPSIMPQHTMNVYTVNSEGETTGEALSLTSVKTNIDAGKSVPYGIDSTSVSATNVNAGDQVTISGKITVANYPYKSNNCLSDIRLAFVLPEGITVNQASISAKYSNGNKLEVLSVTTRAIIKNNNPYTLYIVEFEPGEKIGYYNENLGAIPNGSNVSFSVQLNSDKKMSTQKLKLNESVFVAGFDRINAADGSFKYLSYDDVYDLNENGIYTDKIGGIHPETTTSVAFESPEAKLEITDSLHNTKGETGSSMSLESFADVLNYDLRIACTQGGTADSFYYIIPIGKTTMKAEDDFVSKCEVDLYMQDAAKVVNDNGTAMEVLYTTAAVKNYAEAETLDDSKWYSELPDGANWNDVTMIKVLAKEAMVVNGSVNTISIPLGYEGDDLDYQHLAGYQIKWSSRGFYHYQLGIKEVSGTRSTDGCTITLVYTPEKPIEFTLTAAKGGTPKSGESTHSFPLPKFILAQEYSVREITPYNVNLMDGSYDFGKATSAEANTNFRINISVKDSESDQMGSSPVAIQKNDTIVGKLPGDTAPVFTFSIENADALSDIVTERKVTLTLIGNNGVIVPVIITIKLEMAAAEPTKSAIVAGEVYMPFEDQTETKVSCDSAFTAQFVTEYIPANYKDHMIAFASAPVNGTTITMIDWTDKTDLKYYHYTLNGSEKAVTLTSFEKMGSKDHFEESNNNNLLTERLLFIVSFPKSGEKIGANTVTLKKTIKEGEDSQKPSILSYTTVDKRAFSLQASKNTISFGEEVEFSYTSECSVADSRYTGRKLALVLSPAEGSQFPEDSYIKTGDGLYCYLNSDGNYIVPLKDAQAGNGTVKVSLQAADIESINIDTELWASATASDTNPMMGDQVAGPVSVKVEKEALPSVKVARMNHRVIDTENVTDEITIRVEHEDAKKLTVELQKKIGADYVTQTALLEAVNDITTATQGVFTFTGNDVKIKLNQATTAGTYRLLFTAQNDGGVVTAPYNFIVMD